VPRFEISDVGEIAGGNKYVAPFHLAVIVVEAGPVAMDRLTSPDEHRMAIDDNYREMKWGDVLVSTGDFTDVAYFEARHVVPMSPERYLDLWRSHNRLRTLSTPEQFAAFMQELTDYLASRGDEPIEVSYLCKAWTARRRDEG